MHASTHFHTHHPDTRTHTRTHVAHTEHSHHVYPQQRRLPRLTLFARIDISLPGCGGGDGSILARSNCRPTLAPLNLMVSRALTLAWAVPFTCFFVWWCCNRFIAFFIYSVEENVQEYGR
jgi:hypothetical protein